MAEKTACYACGKQHDAERKRCDCGEPVWFVTDPTEFSSPAEREQGMWPYADLLPVDPPADLGAAAGGTPLVRTPRLDDYVGCTLSVKDETENPTGTFKDRGSAAATGSEPSRTATWR